MPHHARCVPHPAVEPRHSSNTPHRLRVCPDVPRDAGSMGKLSPACPCSTGCGHHTKGCAYALGHVPGHIVRWSNDAQVAHRGCHITQLPVFPFGHPHACSITPCHVPQLTRTPWPPHFIWTTSPIR